MSDTDNKPPTQDAPLRAPSFYGQTWNVPRMLWKPHFSLDRLLWMVSERQAFQAAEEKPCPPGS
jgi:hypothetical protein